MKKSQKSVDNDTQGCYYVCVDNDTNGGEFMNRQLVHPEYYAVRAYQILARKTDKETAEALGISVRTYKDKRKGYSDFKPGEAALLCQLFNVSMDKLFIT